LFSFLAVSLVAVGFAHLNTLFFLFVFRCSLLFGFRLSWGSGLLACVFLFVFGISYDLAFVLLFSLMATSLPFGSLLCFFLRRVVERALGFWELFFWLGGHVFALDGD
jgi:hypothetical protein